MKRYSKQREAVLKAVRQSVIHPSATCVYESVRTEIPNISLGTVYRNLSVLANEGEIRTVSTPDGTERYDGTLENHAHFFCKCCKRITDVIINEQSVISEIEQKINCKIAAGKFVFEGICKNCLEDKKYII